MRSNTILYSVLFLFFITACGGGTDAPIPNKNAHDDLVQKAAQGDKAAMRELEKRLAETVKAEQKSISKLGDTQKWGQQFYWDLAAGKIDEDTLQKLAGEDENIHAQVYMARTAGRRNELALADQKLFIQWLEKISTTDQAHIYHALNGGKYPLAGEAAFMISEDYLNTKWLYPTDQTQAVEWLKKAAKGGQPEAMYKLATRLQYGLGMDKDLSAAKSWLEKSARAGNKVAKNALKNWKE